MKKSYTTALKHFYLFFIRILQKLSENIHLDILERTY